MNISAGQASAWLAQIEDAIDDFVHIKGGRAEALAEEIVPLLDTAADIITELVIELDRAETQSLILKRYYTDRGLAVLCDAHARFRREKENRWCQWAETPIDQSDLICEDCFDGIEIEVGR